MKNKSRVLILLLIGVLVLLIGFIGSQFSPQYDPSLTGKKAWKFTLTGKRMGLTGGWRINLGKEHVLNIKKARLTIDYTVKKQPGTFVVNVTGPKWGHKLSTYKINTLKNNNKQKHITVSVSPELIYQDKRRTALFLKIKERNIRVNKVQLFIDKQKEIVKNEHTIEGYTPHISYYPNETVGVKVHSPESKFNLEVLRYGATVKSVYRKEGISGEKQDYTRDAYREGAHWNTTFSFQIPENWQSGLYACHLTDASGNEFYSSFIVKDLPENTKKIAVIASTNSWQAYNNWGGAGIYRYFLDDQLKPPMAQVVNTQRPNKEANPTTTPVHLASAEKLILGWLEKNGYAYSLISDLDIHQDPNILRKFNTVILNTHAEYWTENMVNSLSSYLKHGGNLAYLSGNGVYAKVVKKGNYLEVRKLFNPSVLDYQPGGLWRHLGKPESQMLGVKYTPLGAGTFAPYEVVAPRHWIYRGTGLKKGDLFGKDGLVQSRAGASGHEQDKMDWHTPTNAVLLAKGKNPMNSGAEMVYYDHKGGGGVYSAGSITFGNSLVVDPKMDRMLKNVLNHFLGTK